MNNNSQLVFTAEQARHLSEPKNKNEEYAVNIILKLIEEQAARSTVRSLKVTDFDFGEVRVLNVFQEKILNSLQSYGYTTQVFPFGGGGFLHISW